MASGSAREKVTPGEAINSAGISFATVQRHRPWWPASSPARWYLVAGKGKKGKKGKGGRGKPASAESLDSDLDGYWGKEVADTKNQKNLDEDLDRCVATKLAAETEQTVLWFASIGPRAGCV